MNATIQGRTYEIPELWVAGYVRSHGGDARDAALAWHEQEPTGKRFNQMSNVGHAKYVVNYHDGQKRHPDGSPFYGIAVFRNKRKLAAFVRALRADGYHDD